jgi:hypothetical protein
VKATELLFHLRPQSIARCFTGPDGRYRKILRAYLAAGAAVFLAEVFEFFYRTRFVAPGSLERIPGYPGAREKAGGRASPRELAHHGQTAH